MNSSLQEYFDTLSIGERLDHDNLSLFPILSENDVSPNFILLDEALEKNFLEVTEVDEAGDIPNLKVINTSDELILLFDGQELFGAKQNRVLNTSILVRPHSEIEIPVSCTEQGRWNYRSRKFASSEIMMPATARASKLSAVSTSLSRGAGHLSDQFGVWEGVQRFLTLSKTDSQTGAMKEAFQSQEKSLKQYSESLQPVGSQVGSIIFINGKLVGCDLVSNRETYSKIHPSLLKSYALDALLGRKEKAASPDKKEAQELLNEAAELQGRVYDSVGAGHEVRFESEKVRGFSLVHEDAPVHTSLFAASLD